jgi:hypothetical protein
MSPSEKCFLVFLTLIFILKGLSFIPGAFDQKFGVSTFSAWDQSGELRHSIWHWISLGNDSAIKTAYITLFSLVAASFAFTIATYVPMFAHSKAMLVFFTFFTTLLSASATSVYFFFVINKLGYTLTSYNYFGVGMYLFMAAEGLEIILLILSVVVYNHRSNSTKWGRF